MQKNLAVIAKYFKKIYKPTNNNLRNSSNSRNKNVDTTPRYKNDNQSEQFGNQRTMTIASQDLWIWHAFFDVVGSNNDINVLYQSPIFNDLKTGRSPEIPFEANGVTYRSGYYLVDGMYPELAPLVKTIPKPADDDHKRILYKQKQESAKKDVERAFGVLKKKWAILANPTRALKKR
nr:putative nuclease HARBI1 [Tanacetum cinerariifolium]